MSLFYITRDAERAAGIDLNKYPGAHILTNQSPLANVLYQRWPEQVLLNDEGYVSTYELMMLYAAYVEKISLNPQILVFKNSRQLERFCQKRNWQMLNPPAELVERFERKISQNQWLAEAKLSINLPDQLITTLERLKHTELLERFGNPYLIQYNIGHTGEGTKIIASPYELEQLASQTPKREVKVMKYLKGQVYTINACVLPNEVKTGRISRQITGLSELTDNSLATVGNDWLMAGKLYSPIVKTSEAEIEFIPSVSKASQQAALASRVEQLAVQVGQIIRLERWSGLFGIDVLIEQTTNEVYFIEINARQPASATFETQLAHLQTAAGPMDWHLGCLLSQALPWPNVPYEITSSQVVLRKKSGPVYGKFKHLTQAGEYSPELKLIETKPVFDLPAGSENLFVIPGAKASGEVMRIQQYGNFNY